MNALMPFLCDKCHFANATMLCAYDEPILGDIYTAARPNQFLEWSEFLF